MRPLLESLLVPGLGAADFLLLALSLGIAAFGVYIRLNARAELRQLRGELRTQEAGLAAARNAEGEAAAQLKRLVEHQKANQARVQYLRARRAEFAHLPYELEEEAGYLGRWCEEHGILLREDRREALRTPSARRP